MNSYYPIFINIENRECIVIGGGNVALRKVETLMKHGANIRVISPEICMELCELAENKKIKLLKRNYKKGDLRGSFIAVVATNNQQVNERIAEEARRERVLVNVVDDPVISDFIVPSSIIRGDVTIAISTCGKSPALARKIRTKLEGQIGEEYSELVNLVNLERTRLKNDSDEVNGDDWQNAIDLDQMVDLIKRGEKEKARALLQENLRKYLK